MRIAAKSKRTNNVREPKRKYDTSSRPLRMDHLVQLRMPRSMYEEIKARADVETFGIGNWIRVACKRQLRKKSLI